MFLQYSPSTPILVFDLNQFGFTWQNIGFVLYNYGEKGYPGSEHCSQFLYLGKQSVGVYRYVGHYVDIHKILQLVRGLTRDIVRQRL